ncbi:MAG: acyl-CoA thioesterase [Nitrospirota bacterium]|nr:acyl-CoA thioesterase [Nitrospirota bacterium]
MQPKRATTLSTWELVFPNDANPYGSMFGGNLMALMDKVGAMAAGNYAQRIVTTASAEAMDFKSPIHVGEQIEIRARVVATGNSSMVVKVDVYTDNPLTGERRHCTTAHFNFVALNTAGRPTPVPPLLVETKDEKRDHEIAGIVQQKAKNRREMIAETEPKG